MQENYWEGTPYDVQFNLLEKWNTWAGFQLTWKQATVCERLDLCSKTGESIAGIDPGLKLPLNGLSSLSEILDIFRAREKIESELKDREQNSPHWEEGRKLYLKELNDYLSIRDHNDFESRDSVQLIAYQDMLMGNGETKKLFQYADYLSPLVWPEMFLRSIDVDRIQDIAKGAALAYIIPKLRAEIEGTQYQERPELSRKDRLKWIATQAELGAIIDELMDKGYIELNTDATKRARLSIASFSFPKNEPSENGLRQCFMNGSNKAPINGLKIPPANTIGK